MGMAYANSLEKEMFLLIIFVSAFLGHPLPSASRVKSCFDIVEARLLLLARLDEERWVNDFFFLKGQDIQVLSMVSVVQDFSLLGVLEISGKQHYVPLVKISSFMQS